MQRAAEAFRQCLDNAPCCARLAPPALPPARDGLIWENILFESPLFRRAHIELFAAPGRCHVLHVCAVPQLHDPAPIFGFDMVGGPARVTGIFLDLSPVMAQHDRLSLREILPEGHRGQFRTPRVLPDWGDVFSPDMLAIRPHDTAEILAALALARRSLAAWLGRSPAPGEACPRIAESQNRYAAAQRKNEHTYRMLSQFVGAAEARRFIDDVLFPEA